DPVIAPEPGPLASYESPGGAHGLRPGRGVVALARQQGENLLVTECPTRRAAIPQPRPLEVSHLGNQPVAPHLVDPALDALVQDPGVEVDADLRALVIRRRRR